MENLKIAMKEEMKDCTFEPLIDKPRGGRSFSNFLEEQRSHSQKREELLTHLHADKEQRESKHIFGAPLISGVIKLYFAGFIYIDAIEFKSYNGEENGE